MSSAQASSFAATTTAAAAASKQTNLPPNTTAQPAPRTSLTAGSHLKSATTSAQSNLTAVQPQNASALSDARRDTESRIRGMLADKTSNGHHLQAQFDDGYGDVSTKWTRIHTDAGSRLPSGLIDLIEKSDNPKQLLSDLQGISGAHGERENYRLVTRK